jgi:glycerol-3-phosphate dehydrogenase subunit B
VNTNADIVIAGMGTAGLFAACRAALAGASVTVLGAGAGALAVSSGCVDILGYLPSGGLRSAREPDETAGSEPVPGNPLDSIPFLPDVHPYRIAGSGAVRAASDFFLDLCREADWPFAFAGRGNHLVPTVMGTLKPTGLCPESVRPESLLDAGHILVAAFEGMRDCLPAFIAGELARRPYFAGKRFSSALLTPPRAGGRRGVNALDVAVALDQGVGLERLIGDLRRSAEGADAVLLPPVCGALPGARVWRTLRDALERPVVEMISMPPGVGGLRLQRFFLRILRARGARIVENALVTGAETEKGRCRAFVVGEGDRYRGRSFVLATGGVLGGGTETEPGKAREAVFGLPVRASSEVREWSRPEVFGAHAFARMGLCVNARLCPGNEDGEEIFSNVHAAGRILAGYDFASEKSGNGVALVTGYRAAEAAMEPA